MEYSGAKREDCSPASLDSMLPRYSAPPYPASYSSADDEINILEYWRIFRKRIWQILLVVLFCVGLSLAGSFLFPKNYKTQATIMALTPSGSGGLSGLANQLSSIPLMGSQLGGLSSLASGKTKELVNILKSRTIAKNIVQKFDLMKIFFSKRWDPQTKTFKPNWMGIVPVEEDAINYFIKRTSNIQEDKKTGLIKVEVTMKDPVIAAKIANEMVVELQRFLEENSFTISKRNRVFIEEQLVRNGAKLLEAGKELNNFYAQNRISSVIPQLDVTVGSYQMVPKPFEEFQKDISELEKSQVEVESKKSPVAVTRVPGQIYLQYLTLNRELIAKAHALLTQQYEMAKIEEAKEDLAFQVIDKAEVKIRPNFPKVFLNLMVGAVAGLFLGIFLAFFREYIQQMKAKEANR